MVSHLQEMQQTTSGGVLSVVIEVLEEDTLFIRHFDTVCHDVVRCIANLQ